MAKIYHITKEHMWESCHSRGAYRGDTLEEEGFIHCSLDRQVLNTANNFFSGERDLIILVIDVARVHAEIRYEGLPDGDQFPHIYGPLNLDAVVSVVPLIPETDGHFELPPGMEQA